MPSNLCGDPNVELKCRLALRALAAGFRAWAWGSRMSGLRSLAWDLGVPRSQFLITVASELCQLTFPT